MAQQVSRHRLGVRRDIEHLVARDPGQRAGRDVADRIPARFARRHAGLGQPAHCGLHVVQRDEVQLYVLPRGDVTESARMALAHLCERLELRRVEDPLRDLDAEHLVVGVLPLAVRSAQQPELAPFVRRDVAALELAEHVDELIDVGCVGEGQPGGSERPRIV
jgi:hypothetical protein